MVKTKMKYRTSKNKSSINKTLIYLLLLSVLLVSGGIFAYNRINNKPVKGSNPQGLQQADLSPPTKKELQDTAAHKDNLGNDPTSNTTPTSQPDGRKSVKPLITYARQTDNKNDIEVSSYVPGIVEQTGTCTLTASKDGQKVIRDVTILRSATSTNCRNFMIPTADFPLKGIWQITVTFSSNSSYGNSDVSNLEVN